MNTLTNKLCYMDIGHDPGPATLFWMSGDGEQYKQKNVVNPVWKEVWGWDKVETHNSFEDDREYGFYSDDGLNSGLRGRIDDAKQIISVVSYDGTLTRAQETCLRHWADKQDYKIMFFG